MSCPCGSGVIAHKTFAYNRMVCLRIFHSHCWSLVDSSQPRLHAIKARSCASSVFSTALAGTGSTWAPHKWGLTAALVNSPRLTCFPQQSPLLEVASKQWQALPGGAHLLVFFHVTLQEPNKETRKRTGKMKNASKIKIAETLKQMQKKWIQNKPFGSFSEHSGTQSLKVQRDCLDYCFVTSMITTGISGISRWPSRGMSCIGITAAALQSMIDNWQFYFPLSCGSSRGTCCGKPSLELLCKIICCQVQSILDNFHTENGRREMLKSVCNIACTIGNYTVCIAIH